MHQAQSNVVKRVQETPNMGNDPLGRSSSSYCTSNSDGQYPVQRPNPKYESCNNFRKVSAQEAWAGIYRWPGQCCEALKDIFEGQDVCSLGKHKNRLLGLTVHSLIHRKFRYSERIKRKLYRNTIRAYIRCNMPCTSTAYTNSQLLLSALMRFMILNMRYSDVNRRPRRLDCGVHPLYSIGLSGEFNVVSCRKSTGYYSFGRGPVRSLDHVDYQECTRPLTFLHVNYSPVRVPEGSVDRIFLR